MANLTLVSPLRGWCAPLDETPDAVFAQRLLGDGVAIDPTEGVLHAPCDGRIAASKSPVPQPISSTRRPGGMRKL